MAQSCTSSDNIFEMSMRDSAEKPPEKDAAGGGPSNYVRLMAIIASINSCNLGYDQGVNAGVVSSFQRKGGDGLRLSDLQIEFFIGLLSFTALIGAMIMPIITDRYGRRWTLFSSQLIFISGITVMICAPGYGVLMFGRGITGIGIGIGLAIDAMYIAEIAPAKHRGQLVSWSETADNTGILLGFIASYVFRNTPGDAQWRATIGLGLILPSLMLFLVYFVLSESPRWLIKQGRREEAADVLAKCNHGNVVSVSGGGVVANQDRVRDANNMTAVAAPSNLKTSINDNDGSSSNSSNSSSCSSSMGMELVQQLEEEMRKEERASAGMTWNRIFSDPVSRRKLYAGVGTAIIQQMTGEESILYYMISILADAGITSVDEQFGALVVVGIAKVLAIIVAGYVFDYSGRRPLLMLSNAGIALSLFLLAGVSNRVPAAGFAALVLYVVAFSSGMGPGAWLIPSEVFSNDIRAKGMSLCTFSNRSASLLVSSTFLSMRRAMTNTGIFLFYGALAVCGIVYIFIFVPETRGRNLEQVHELFESMLSQSRQHLLSPSQRAREGETA